jgi:hypothetical protein
MLVVAIESSVAFDGAVCLAEAWIYSSVRSTKVAILLSSEDTFPCASEESDWGCEA